MPGAIKRGGLSRRKFVALAGAAAAGAPFLNLGNYRLFADSPAVYSDRAIALVNDSLVIDMLSLFDLGRLIQAETSGSDPFRFTREELLAVRESGIDVFHPATGMGGPDVAVDVLTHMAGYNGLIAEHPDLLIVDRIAGVPRCQGKEFDYLDYFMQNRVFADAFENYEHLMDFDRYRIYRRKKLKK